MLKETPLKREELEQTRKEDAINFLLGKSERGREAIEKDDNLKFFHELYKANENTSSKGQSEEEKKSRGDS